MSPENDKLISQLTVRIRNSVTEQVQGSGILYSTKDKVYLLTAAHCLYADNDTFQQPLDKVIVDIYKPATDSYIPFEMEIDYKLVCPNIDADVAVLIMEKAAVESIIGKLSFIVAVAERQSATEFVVKGFPNATQGRELDLIRPVWKQKMTGVNKFQLQLNENYNGWATTGFSGSGIFLHTHNEVYLYGIFTRFRAEEMGKVIYGQFIHTVNEILAANWLPTIPFTFLGQDGLNAAFFDRHIDTAVKNLGPRFSEELNLRMPVSKLFNAVAKDEFFKRDVLALFDTYLLTKNGVNFDANNEIIKTVETAFKATRSHIREWVAGIPWLPSSRMNFEDVAEIIKQFNELVALKRAQLYELQRQTQKADERKKRDYSYRPPYEKELDRLDTISSANNELLNEVYDVSLALADSPLLLIKGDAGCGKSHLLGDIATLRSKYSRPTLLLLGQLFKREHSVWKNILEQLQLHCTKNELLSTLNDIGRQIGSRVLILIDALNEGDGRTIWPNELAGLVSDIRQYPNIGLVLTVRSVYWDAVVPKSVQNNNDIMQITHEGFRGNEYEALKLFCAHYGIRQPNFPILAPEYANPLFLQLICQAVKFSPDRKFPQGFQGISRLFAFYLGDVNRKLTEKRDEYALRKKLAEEAILELARACFADPSRVILLETAVRLFDTRFPQHRFLLNDLIQENVFIQSLRKDYDKEVDEEVVYFSYERFGDFFIAQELLKEYSTTAHLHKAFGREGSMGQLLLENYYRNNGILEAMAVILPEQFQLEITEVYAWAFTDEDEQIRWIASEWVNHWLLTSLKWRNAASVEANKLSAWFNSDNFNMDFHKYINTIIELVPVSGHSYNGDRMQVNFMRFTMPERDGFLQQFFYYYNEKDDGGTPYPVRRMIEWAWQPGISKLIDEETARLTGQFLAWVLCVTQRKLRDEATKAMVNLLEEQPGALIAILRAFESVDDLYILERLYAVAYGCALRTSQSTALQKIAQYVYNVIFAAGNPPVHILLRDYARNTVEYAVYQNLGLEGDLAKIRPPYNSLMPDSMPTDEEMTAYELDNKSENFKNNYGYEYNRIKFSVIGWDFGRYTIESAFREFCSNSFHVEDEVNSFIKALKPQKRDLVKLFITLYEGLAKVRQKNKGGAIFATFEDGRTIHHLYEEQLNQVDGIMETKLEENEREFITVRVVPYLESKMRTQRGSRQAFETGPCKRWIVRRVFELGYDVNLHGEFDSRSVRYNNRSENTVERIGKKYQWIAFHEILARTTDNHKLCESWSSKTKIDFYQGPWQKYLRDIDPVFTTRRPSKGDENGEEMLGIVEPITDWWLPEPYTYWNQRNEDWITNTQDMPDPKMILMRRNELGEDWLYLHLDINYDEPKPIGTDDFTRLKKGMWYSFQTYLVKKDKKAKIVNWLNGQNFFGRWMPESQPLSGLFNRESFWSPASKYYQKTQKLWENLEGSRHKVIIATIDAVGELSKDNSGAHYVYRMPCQTIFEGMGLRYAPKDGDFSNVAGEIVVTNSNPRGVLIRKKDFIDFLEENRLEIVWTLLGEKNVWSSQHRDPEISLKVISGVYTLGADGKVSGGFKILDRE